MVIDTLKTARDLRTAGLPQEQAEAVAHAINEAHQADFAKLATKDDLARLEAATKADIARLEAAVKADLATTKADIARLETSTKADIRNLGNEIELVRRDMEILRRDLTIKMGTMFVMAVGIILAAIRYLPAH